MQTEWRTDRDDLHAGPVPFLKRFPGTIWSKAMTGWKAVFLGIALGSCFLLFDGYRPDPALATHEADHRFLVFGYVRDGQGRPLAGQRVVVVDTRLNHGKAAETGRDGYYEALLHLHNEDLGDEITVTVGDERKTTKAEFDPQDQHTDRKAQVDFGPPPAAGTPAGPGRGWSYGLTVVVAGLLVMGFLRYRKQTRTQPRKKTK
jgi:hypothetical protein